MRAFQKDTNLFFQPLYIRNLGGSFLQRLYSNAAAVEIDEIIPIFLTQVDMH